MYNDNVKTPVSNHPILLEVIAKPGDTSEKLIRRFLKKMKKSKLMDEIKEHEFYEKPSEKKRRKNKRRRQVLAKLQRERDAKDI